MAWYNPLSWGEKVTDNVLDKDDGLLTQVGNWIGGQQYTAEEEAEARTELRKGVTAYAISSMGENSLRSIARREIAVIWIKAQLGLVLMCAISAPWDMSLAEFYFKLATASIMLGGTGAIITFFFGSYMLARHNETKK